MRTESSPGLTIRQANELGDYMKSETLKILNDPTMEPKPFTETEFFARRLHLELLQGKHGRRLVSEPLPRDVPTNVVSALEKHFGRKRSEIRRADLLSLRNVDIATIARVSEEKAQEIRLAMLGVMFKDRSKGPGASRRKPQRGGGGSATKRAGS